MESSLPTKGNPFPPGAATDRLRELASFRTTYVAIVAFVFLYVFTVQGAERLLQRHFQGAVRIAAEASPGDDSVVGQIRRAVRRTVRESTWVRVWGVQVTAIVLGADGSAVYTGGLPLPPSSRDPLAWARESERILPASSDVTVSVPHNSLLANAILVFYAGALLTVLYLYQRAVAARQEALIADAVGAREAAAARAGQIERELDGVRQRLDEVDLTGHHQAREISGLRAERQALSEKLAALELRESELLSERREGREELASEHAALEELLDEALADLQRKDEEIGSLNTRLRRASKDADAAAASQGREADQLGRRLRTLYKTLELDERAISDLVKLKDETMKLRAEEALKRLADDVESAGSRRKVGGLPTGIPVFEIGYAGKGRIYYTHGEQRRLRILCVGAKNSQKKDLDYLARIVTL